MTRTVALLLLFTITVPVGCRPAISTDTDFALRLAYRTPHEGARETVVASTDEIVYVMPANLVNGTDVLGVRITMDERGRPALAIELTESAAETMFSFTKQHKNNLLAIVVDEDTLYALPIESEFSSSFRITGQFTDEEAKEVYSLLTGYD